MNAPPVAQLQVQYPVIDELADEFAMLIADMTRELHSLSPDRLQGLKALIEEKLKSKGTRITIPSSANELIGTISKYWDCLSFEFARLVVRYLGKEGLQDWLRRYEEDLQRKAEILLTHCRQNTIAPRAPPDCSSMKITVNEDPHSFSLHRILAIKDFLVYKLGMNMALFTGWRHSSVVLHFYILDNDMETAVRQLKEHEIQLRGMQVEAIEVKNVTVYHEAPIERHSSIAALSSKIDYLADAKLVELRSTVVAVVEKVQAILQEVNIEEINKIIHVQTAVHDLKLVVKCAYGLVDKVDDILYCYQSDSMAAARKGSGCTPPDLKPICDMKNCLGNSLAQVEIKYLEFVDACSSAIHSCSTAEEACARMEEEFYNKKNAARGIGGAVAGTALAGGAAATAGGVVATGIIASAVAGAFTFGVGAIVGLAITATATTALGVAGAAAGVGTAVTTHFIANKYAKSEAAFRKIQRDFDTLMHFAYGIKERVAQVRVRLEDIEALDNSNMYCSEEHLERVCVYTQSFT